MIPKTIIEKAFEGGYKSRVGDLVSWEEIALDPAFWQCLGKALGWERYTMPYGDWKMYARRFYDLILTGQSTDEFWKELYQIH